MTGLRINTHERRAILALMRHTPLTDREIAGLVGRGLWTVFHVRKAAGIPATNKGRAEWVSRPEAEQDAPPADIRSYWLSTDTRLRSA
jgi:hypothetical protein